MRWLNCITVLSCLVTSRALEDLPWWKTAVFYQVYPRSFKDSDGDGVGDLRGIAQAADYFKEIGVDAIWMNPINKSPMVDFGYDISNYTDIDPTFGTFEDFDALVKKLREIDVKLVIDFVPNHSSDQHPWFQKSLDTVKYPEYKDYYVWRDAKATVNGVPQPPNNWLSVFGGPAWNWSDQRSQFYLHKFADKQPDLNYRCDPMNADMMKVINFWLDKGVDGFRMDSVAHIYENKNFPDELPVPGTSGKTYDTLQHIYELNQPETFDLLKNWTKAVYQRVLKDGRPRALFLEVYETIPTTMKYYGSGNESLSFPFNFNLLTKGTHATRPADIKQIIDDWMSVMPKGAVANWVVGNHDNGRVADRYGPEMVDAINLLIGVLPGVQVTYYGEELGMRNTYVRWDETKDPSGIKLGPDHYLEGSRDPERTPMQWNNLKTAGFSKNSTTWLPVDPNYWWLNVEAQKAAEHSHLKVFKTLSKARKDPVLQRGDLSVLVPNSDTLLVNRSYNGIHYVLIINMGSDSLDYTSNTLFSGLGMDWDMSVVVSSINCNYEPGFKLQKGSLSVSLRPKAAILLRTTTNTAGSTGSRYSIPCLLICCLLALVRP